MLPLPFASPLFDTVLYFRLATRVVGVWRYLVRLFRTVQPIQTNEIGTFADGAEDDACTKVKTSSADARYVLLFVVCTAAVRQCLDGM